MTKYKIRMLCCLGLFLRYLSPPPAAMATPSDKPETNAQTAAGKSPAKDSFAEYLKVAQSSVDNLAAALKRGAKDDHSSEAWKALQKAELEARVFGESDPRLADVEMLWGRYKSLVGNITTEHYAKALAIREKRFGPESLPVEASLMALAPVLARLGKPAEASDAINRAIEIVEAKKGKGAAQLADGLEQAMDNGLKRAGDSTRLARKVLRLMQAQLKPSDPIIARMMHLLAQCEMAKPRSYPFASGNDDAVIVSLNEAITAQQKSGGGKLQLAAMYESLAERQSSNGKNADAAKTYETVVSLRSASAAEDNRLLARTYDKMADYLKNTQQMAKAEEYKKRSLAIWEKEPGPSNLNLINGLSSMAYFYKSAGQLQKAAPYLERRMAIAIKQNPRDMSEVESLANLYMEMKDYAKADPYLKKWFAMRADEGRSRGPNYVNYDLVPIAESLCEAETHIGRLSEAEKHINLAKNYYDHQDKKFASQGEIYPERFLTVYTEYLRKAGKMEEFTTFSARLAALRQKIQQICAGCGRG